VSQRYTVCRRAANGRWLFLARFGGRTAFTKHISQAKVFYDPRVAALEVLEDDEVVRPIDIHAICHQEAA
jgi:hypothetical protein